MKQYTIQKGDTLWKISKSNGVSLEALIAANPQISNPDVIQIGQVISIPTSPGGSDAALVEPTAAPVGETPVATESTVSQAEVVTPTEVVTAEKAETAHMEAPAGKAETASTPSKWGQMWKYVVKPGDTMWKIAKQAGITLDQLVAANPQVANPDQIQTGQVLNIPSGSMLWKDKATAPTQVAPSAMNKKEMLTMPKPSAVAPITTEVPVMEKKFELPPLEFPKMQQLPNINVPINIPIEANDVIQQKTYNIGPVGNKTYSAPVMQGPISSDPVTQAPVYAPMATAPMATAPASVYSMHHHHMHHHPHCICKTVIHGPGCTCFIKHKHHAHYHHMSPHCYMHYTYVHPHAYVEPQAYMAPHYGGGYYQSPVAYGSAQTGAPGELGPYSYQPYQPTHQSASIHG